MAVAREQRHARQHRCPVCDGADEDPRDKGRRCHGFTSVDGAWARCSREDHAGALSADDNGLFVHRMHGPCKCGQTHGSDGPCAKEIERVYSYRDERGTILYEVVRKVGKRFAQRRPDGAGGHEWNLNGVRRLLYRLPELLEDDADRAVYVVEGEKDADSVAACGVLATCNPGGAGKWSSVAELANQVLLDRDVVVVADADEVGRRHAREVGTRLAAVARSLRVVEPPAPNKDVTDLLRAGGTLAQLVPLAEQKQSRARRGDADRIAVGDRLLPSGDAVDIDIGFDLERVVTETISALGRAPNVYARGGMLVRVVSDVDDAPAKVRRDLMGPAIRPHTAATLEVELSLVVRFTCTKAHGERARCAAPTKVIGAILDAGAWPGIRPLSGVASAPILRADGTVAQAQGYDAASGYLLVFNDAAIKIAETPSLSDAIVARDALLHVVRDFPFKTDDDRAAWLGLVLTLFARAAIDGPCPMWIASANVRGAGKSRLIDAAALIATGRSAPRATQPSDDAEAGKLITSVIMAGDDLLLMDNIDRPLGGSKLDALLTGERWKDRVLGVNQTIDLPIRLVLAGTGNNIEIHGDTIRRVLPIRLDSSEEHPEDRRDFTIEGPLLAYVRVNRPRLVAHALTVLRAWYVAGEPKDEDVKVWGSFEAWASFVPHVLRFLGLPDPQRTREGLERDDPRHRAMGVVIGCWRALETSCQQVNGITIREALDRLYPHGHPASNDGFAELREAIEVLAPGRGPARADARALGNAFRKTHRRVLDGRRLTELGADTHAGVARWGVR